MTTVLSENVHNIALEGNFDDCQILVKLLLLDGLLKKRLNISSVNSINWARVMAQIIYYVYCGMKLKDLNENIVFTVPTGNFVDIMHRELLGGESHNSEE